MFTTAPVLAYYDYTKKTVVETDASNWASGGVLYQAGEDSKLKPVAFFSAKHSAPECNYEIYDKELLAIVKALEELNCRELSSRSRSLQTTRTSRRL